MYGNIYWFVITITIAIIASHSSTIFLFSYLLAMFFFYKQKKINMLFLLLIILASTIIYFYYEYLQTESSREIPPYIEEINGKIHSEVKITPQLINFQFQPTEINSDIMITYFLTEKDNLQSNNEIKTGSVCVLKNLTAQNNFAKNPGQFDYQRYLVNSGIKASYTISTLENIACRNEGKINVIYDFKRKIVNYVEKRYSTYTSSWIRALIFGDKEGLDDEIIALFQRWNLSHLLAISGLHVGLIILMFYMLMLRLPFFTKEKSQCVLFILLLFYPLIAGEAPSVWRSCLLALFVLIQLKFKFAFSSLDILSIVFVVMLLVDPYSIYQLGFQFSFIVTFAIILSRIIIHEAGNYLQIIIQISGISLLIILPIQLYHFYTFNPLAIAINLLYIPYFSFIIIPLSLLMVVFSALPVIPQLFDYFFVKIQSLFSTILERIDESLYYPLIVGKFPMSLFFLYYILIIVFFMFWERQQKIRAFCVGVSITVLLIGISISPYFNDEGTITVLDIGQGDAIIIELPYRKGVIMIDAAGTMTKNFTEPSNKNFEEIIKPFLLSKGITKIDALFLSHDDHDHIGSVPFILDEFIVDKVFTTKYFDKAWISEYIINNKETAFHHLTGGQILSIAGHKIEVLLPVEDNFDKNDNSLVLRSRFGPYTWIFTGDIGEKAELELMSLYPNLGSDILKVSHHGSSSSTTDEFLEGVKPKAALISVGVNNRYNHPNKEVLERLGEKEIAVLRTDQSGAIIYSYTKKEGTLFTFMNNIQNKKGRR
ncbi:DNA internalization-related competence protein ComEC/Rec2 [Saliterribacillus persicus]|uniref:Competence protein ComEC n=1 Tax=Saliterribacillus persicus TaxID=930114 RepID=A0A368XC71_9BACI|nr:DNA internalization-related competence protein ComEC/Rec2 [Saliterribacillus persicus]RCW65309.1 competence protein ComEC [Saliterribacillus persicus]